MKIFRYITLNNILLISPVLTFLKMWLLENLHYICGSDCVFV